MYRIAICDDKDDICVQISEYLQKILKMNKILYSIEIFYDGSELISFLEKGNSFDIIFLDIEMEVKDGIDVGNFIRHKLKNYSTEIAFISAADHYDRKLFDFQPIAFLPKPITETMVTETINLLFVRHNKYSFYSYKVNRDLIRVPISEILYLKSDDRKIKIVTTSGSDTFYGKINDEEKKLSEHGFILVNRSNLINFFHIKSVSSTEISLKDGSIFSISRVKNKEVIELLIERGLI